MTLYHSECYLFCGYLKQEDKDKLTILILASPPSALSPFLNYSLPNTPSPTDIAPNSPHIEFNASFNPLTFLPPQQ